MLKKSLLITASILAIFVPLTAVILGCGGDGDGHGEYNAQSTALEVEPSTLSESKGLSFMREEEKLARDVYLTSFEKWDLQIFSNISSSEEKHMAAVLNLMERRGLTDPAADTKVGEFTDPKLQGLYDTLTTKSAGSEIDALLVGAEIEEIDLLDLAAQLASQPAEDLQRVYTNLSRASRNHLRAFTRQLKERGVNYTPKHLIQSDFDAIISTERERGKGRGMGQGRRGHGQGNGQGKGDGRGQGRGHGRGR